MTPRNFPPADQCSPEDLDAIADLVVSDPRASYDLAGSRAHIEALCRRYQALVQEADLVALLLQAGGCDRTQPLAVQAQDIQERHHAASRAAIALERALAAATNDLDAARKAIAEREDEIARVNNERQAEVNEAAAQRERADAAEARAEVFEATARAALAILARRTVDNAVSLAELVHAVDGRLSRALLRERKISAALSDQWEAALIKLEEIQQTDAANERLRSAFADACLGIAGIPIEQVNIRLDEELAAHPDPGPLHHARDQRDQEHHPFVIGKFKRGDRGGQWPEETCDVCGTDPHNAIHQ